VETVTVGVTISTHYTPDRGDHTPPARPRSRPEALRPPHPAARAAELVGGEVTMSTHSGWDAGEPAG